MKKNKLLLIAISVGILSICKAQTFSVLPQNYQTIKGWGCFPSYCRTDWEPASNVVKRNSIFDKPEVQKALYTDLGITHIRVDLQPRFYNCYDNSLDTAELADLLKQIKLAQNKGINKWIISIWSPPCCMKTPANIKGTTVNGDVDCLTNQSIPAGTKTKFINTEANKNRFVDYISKSLAYINKQGCGLPENISIQNEPLHAPDYDALAYDFWDNAEVNLSNRILYQSIIKKLRHSLDSLSMNSIGIVAVEGNDVGHQGQLLPSSDLQKDPSNTFPAINACISAFATHSYDQWGSNIGSQIGYKNMANTFGKDIWMTEWCPLYDNGTVFDGSTPLGECMGTFRHFTREMVSLGVNYWFFWKGWSYGNTSKGAEETLLYGVDETPLYTKKYYVFQKLWKNVLPGYVVKPMSSSINTVLIANNDYGTDANNPADTEMQFNMVAFDGRKNQSMVVLLINHTSNAYSNIEITGLAGTNLSLFETNSSEDMLNKGTFSIVSGKAVINVPPNSIQVLVTNEGGQTSTVFDIPATIEAEQAELVNGATINTNHKGFSGTGFVDNYKAIGIKTLFRVNATTAGNYDFKLFYANAMANSSLSIYLNGIKTKQTLLPLSGTSWDSWISVNEVLILNMGVNTVEYVMDATDGGNVNLDKVVVTKPAVTGLDSDNNISNGKIFPNPFTSSIHISQKQAWQLYNGLGQLIAEGNSDIIEGASLESGFYVLKLANNSVIKLRK